MLLKKKFFFFHLYLVLVQKTFPLFQMSNRIHKYEFYKISVYRSCKTQLTAKLTWQICWTNCSQNNVSKISRFKPFRCEPPTSSLSFEKKRLSTILPIHSCFPLVMNICGFKASVWKWCPFAETIIVRLVGNRVYECIYQMCTMLCQPKQDKGLNLKHREYLVQIALVNRLYVLWTSSRDICSTNNVDLLTTERVERLKLATKTISFDTLNRSVLIEQKCRCFQFNWTNVHIQNRQGKNCQKIVKATEVTKTKKIGKNFVYDTQTNHQASHRAIGLSKKFQHALSSPS